MSSRGQPASASHLGVDRFREQRSWPGLAALRLASEVFQVTVYGSWGTIRLPVPERCSLSDSEAFRQLCLSLYVLLEVKEARKLDRTIGLRN